MSPVVDSHVDNRLLSSKRVQLFVFWHVLSRNADISGMTSARLAATLTPALTGATKGRDTAALGRVVALLIERPALISDPPAVSKPLEVLVRDQARETAARKPPPPKGPSPQARQAAQAEMWRLREEELRVAVTQQQQQQQRVFTDRPGSPQRRSRSLLREPPPSAPASSFRVPEVETALRSSYKRPAPAKAWVVTAQPPPWERSTVLADLPLEQPARRRRAEVENQFRQLAASTPTVPFAPNYNPSGSVVSHARRPLGPVPAATSGNVVPRSGNSGLAAWDEQERRRERQARLKEVENQFRQLRQRSLPH